MELSKVDTEVSITLKDLTDLIGVEHNKAMKKVEELSLEPSFGTLAKIATVYNDKGQTIQTYSLNKKQAIAAGAKLNNALLMKVIDKMEELQKQLNQPKSMVSKEIMLLAQGYQLIESKVDDIQSEVELLKNDIVLTPSQKRILQKAVSQKVYSFHSPQEANKKLFSKIYSKLKDRFAVSSYMEIQRLKFDEAKNMIENISLIDLV